jgi:hypothetical protein
MKCRLYEETGKTYLLADSRLVQGIWGMKLVYLVILSVPISMTILVFPEHINNPGLSKGTNITLSQMRAIKYLIDYRSPPSN